MVGMLRTRDPEVVNSTWGHPLPQTHFHFITNKGRFFPPIGKFGSKSDKTVKKIKIRYNPQEQPASVNILFSKCVLEFPETKITSDANPEHSFEAIISNQP